MAGASMTACKTTKGTTRSFEGWSAAGLTSRRHDPRSLIPLPAASIFISYRCHPEWRSTTKPTTPKTRHCASGPLAFFQASMPPAMWHAVLIPASCAA